MPARGDLANEFRVLLCDPTKDEECGLRFVAIEQIESFYCVLP